jgi:hypothetical protein
MLCTLLCCPLFYVYVVVLLAVVCSLVFSNSSMQSTMFNDGVINMGRALVLFAFTSQMGQQYPTNAWKFWNIYHAVLKGTEYEYFNRSLIQTQSSYTSVLYRFPCLNDIYLPFSLFS